MRKKLSRLPQGPRGHDDETAPDVRGGAGVGGMPLRAAVAVRPIPEEREDAGEKGAAPR